MQDAWTSLPVAFGYGPPGFSRFFRGVEYGFYPAVNMPDGLASAAIERLENSFRLHHEAFA